MRPRLRTLHVDDLQYTWTARIRAAPGPDGYRHRCIRIRVQGGGKSSSVLQADVVERFQPAPAGGTYPFPAAADVRTLIDHARRHGWAPQSRGATFQVNSAADVTLPGFVITDLLWISEQRPARPGPG